MFRKRTLQVIMQSRESSINSHTMHTCIGWQQKKNHLSSLSVYFIDCMYLIERRWYPVHKQQLWGCVRRLEREKEALELGRRWEHKNQPELRRVADVSSTRRRQSRDCSSTLHSPEHTYHRISGRELRSNFLCCFSHRTIFFFVSLFVASLEFSLYRVSLGSGWMENVHVAKSNLIELNRVSLYFVEFRFEFSVSRTKQKWGKDKESGTRWKSD